MSTSAIGLSRPETKISKSAVLKWAGSAAGGALVVTSLVGVLHLPFAAPLLRAISPASLCPVTRGSPEQIDRGREIAAASIRSSTSAVAPARPALVFTLDQSRRQDIDAWAARSNVRCSNISGNENLRRCVQVPAAALGQDPTLPALEEITFELRASGELVNVQTMRRGLTADEAVRTAQTLEQSLATTVGAPSTTGGEPTARHLGHGFMMTYVAEHTFVDYRATVTATNMAHTGMMVREEYLSTR